MLLGAALPGSTRKGAPESISRQIRERPHGANLHDMQHHSGQSTKPSANCCLDTKRNRSPKLAASRDFGKSETPLCTYMYERRESSISNPRSVGTRRSRALIVLVSLLLALMAGSGAT